MWQVKFVGEAETQPIDLLASEELLDKEQLIPTCELASTPDELKLNRRPWSKGWDRCAAVTAPKTAETAQRRWDDAAPRLHLG